MTVYIIYKLVPSLASVFGLTFMALTSLILIITGVLNLIISKHEIILDLKNDKIIVNKTNLF